MNKTRNTNESKKSYSNKRGVVPNTKLVFEENKADLLNSPMIGVQKEEISLNNYHNSQQNPVIYKASQNLAENKQQENKHMFEVQKKSMPLVYDHNM